MGIAEMMRRSPTRLGWRRVLPKRVGLPRAASTRAAATLCLAMAIAVMGAPVARVAAQTVDAKAEPKPKPAAKRKSARSRKGKAETAGTAAPVKPLDPETALGEARRLLAGGKAQEAAALANRVLSEAPKSSRTTARALAVRGEAQLRQGQIAQAIVDLDGALWVANGLATIERTQAIAAQQEAYRLAGLAAPGPSERIAGAGKRTSAGGKSSQVASATEPAKPQAGGIGGFFSNLLGLKSGDAGASKPETTASLRPAVPRAAATSASEPQRAGPPPRTEAPRMVAVEPRSRKPVARASVMTSEPAGLTGGGKYRLQLAAVRSRKEALALAGAVKSQHPDVLGPQKFDVHEAVFGNMGRFYRVRIGSFANLVESEAICASLRQKGHDCMVISQ